MGTLNVYVTSSYTPRKRRVWSSDTNGVLQQNQWQMATVNGNIIRLPVGWFTYQVSVNNIFEWNIKRIYSTKKKSRQEGCNWSCLINNDFEKTIGTI